MANIYDLLSTSTIPFCKLIVNQREQMHQNLTVFSCYDGIFSTQKHNG